MISVAALRMQQFGVQFYQASLTAKDIDKLVRFEVLSYGEQGAAPGVRGARGSRRCAGICSNGASRRARRRISARSSARRSTSSSRYYEQCRQARDLPSIAGAVIISCDEPLKFEPIDGDPSLGILKVPEREGILRAIDGQHRLLALHAGIEQFGDENFTVPAVIFDRLPEDHVVQMFVTINAKHTRLNASHLVSLSGRQLYRDENLAAAHDVVRALSEREDSPLLRRDQAARRRPRPRRAGAARAGAEEAVRDRRVRRRARRATSSAKRRSKFFVNYFRQVAVVFGAAWNGRKYSIKSAPRAARVHPRRAGNRAAARSAARRPRGLPRDRPRHRAVGPPHRRSAVRDRRRLEAIRTRPSISSPRNCGSRCSTPKARWSRTVVRSEGQKSEVRSAERAGACARPC